jgi:hypothetical protein
MTRLQAIRIALLLLVIFAAGVVTGRLTAPQPPALVASANGQEALADVAFGRLNKVLNLSPEQERPFRALLEDIAREMAPLPRGSTNRLELFRKSVPRMAALLRPDQQATLKRYARETETRFERQAQRRAKLGR